MTLTRTHVFPSRLAFGTAVPDVAGVEGSGSTLEGIFSSWNEGFRLGKGIQFTHDRPWLGKSVSWPRATAP